MKVNINGLLYALSYALDSVENELLGMSMGHAKRVAYVSVTLGKALQLSTEKLSDIAVCAVMHDNAMTQYAYEEAKKSGPDAVNAGGIHCLYGEKNLLHFPFRTDMKGVILYHHERADGKGPLRRKGKDTPLASQLIHLADILDKVCDLGNNNETKYQKVLEFLEKSRDELFLGEHVDLFKRNFSESDLEKLSENRIEKELRNLIPDVMIDYSGIEMIHVMDIFAKIIDYKSEYTRNHSLSVADKARKMGQYYQYDPDICLRLYIAGALHDIGKLSIKTDVLEKTGGLSGNEYAYVQNHAWFTYKILSQIEGFEDIARWASYHHEKLDGTGYPFGKTAKELDHKERLLACLDIYQALLEPRPYKEGHTHEECIRIMRGMVEEGKIDNSITEDINTYFKGE